MPQQLSGGMARRVALARAIVMDPEVLIYDEPFVGLDPISMGIIVRLIRHLNDALGITSIVVSHDVQEVGSIADYSYLLAGGTVVASGTTAELNASQRSGGAAVHAGRRRWPGVVPLSRCRLPRIAAAPRMPHDGARSRRMGAVALFLVQVLAACGPALLRPVAHRAPDLQQRRTFAGHHHAVRPVRRHDPGPAGAMTCWRDSAVNPRLASLAALGLREGTGPGGHRAAVRRPGRHVADFRDRPDARHRPAHRHAGDGRRSDAPCGGAALHRRCDRHAAAGGHLQRASASSARSSSASR